MNAPTRRLLLCTALIGAAGMAQAQSTGLTRAAIEAAYAEFERIEIAFGPSQVKVEAIDAQTGQVVEAIYDRATGAILKEETGSITGTNRYCSGLYCSISSPSRICLLPCNNRQSVGSYKVGVADVGALLRYSFKPGTQLSLIPVSFSSCCTGCSIC